MMGYTEVIRRADRWWGGKEWRVVAAAEAFYDCDLVDFDKKLAELGKALGAQAAPAAETTKKDQTEDTEMW